MGWLLPDSQRQHDCSRLGARIEHEYPRAYRVSARVSSTSIRAPRIEPLYAHRACILSLRNAPGLPRGQPLPFGAFQARIQGPRARAGELAGQRVHFVQSVARAANLWRVDVALVSNYVALVVAHANNGARFAALVAVGRLGLRAHAPDRSPDRRHARTAAGGNRTPPGRHTLRGGRHPLFHSPSPVSVALKLSPKEVRVLARGFPPTSPGAAAAWR